MAQPLPQVYGLYPHGHAAMAAFHPLAAAKDSAFQFPSMNDSLTAYAVTYIISPERVGKFCEIQFSCKNVMIFVERCSIMYHV